MPCDLRYWLFGIKLSSKVIIKLDIKSMAKNSKQSVLSWITKGVPGYRLYLLPSAEGAWGSPPRSGKFTKLSKCLMLVFKSSPQSTHIPMDPKILKQYIEHCGLNNQKNSQANQQLLSDFLKDPSISDVYRKRFVDRYANDEGVLSGWTQLTTLRLVAEYNKMVVEDTLGNHILDNLMAVQAFDEIGLDLYALRSGQEKISFDKISLLQKWRFKNRYRGFINSVKRLLFLKRLNKRQPRLDVFMKEHSVPEKYQAMLRDVFRSWKFWGPHQMVGDLEFQGVYNAIVLEDVLGEDFDIENPVLVELFEDKGMDIENLLAGELVLSSKEIGYLESEEFRSEVNKLKAK